MAEYICRELLKRAVHASDLENREKMALLTCISSIPSAEVAPVRHGRFVGGYKMISGKWVYEKPRCSECGKESSGATRYCPNCGAKMDGGEEGC